MVTREYKTILLYVLHMTFAFSSEIYWHMENIFILLVN